MIRAGLITLLTLLAALPAFAVDAERQPVQLSLVPQVARSRDGVMMVMDATLASELTRIVRGRLDLTLRADDQPVLSMSVPEIVVAPGPQTMTLTLPPAPTLNHQELSLEATLATDQGGLDIDLGQHLLTMRGSEQRSLVVGVCAGLTDSWHRLGDLLATLSLERFDPTRPKGPAIDGVYREPLATTAPAPLGAQRLPTTALGYTPFDLMVLSGEGFAAASPAALEALRHWVRAGGSVLILPSTRLADHHVALLNALAVDTPGAPAFSLSDDGQLRTDSPSAAATLHRFHAGLGRAVIATGGFDADRDLAQRPWQEAVLFLWKVRRSQWAPMLAGAWSGQHQSRVTPQETDPAPSLPPSLAMVDHPFHALLPAALAPTSIVLTPLPVLAAVLLGYILLIGPADYLLLGALRRRTLTWLALPLVTALTTLALMRLSQHYLGSSDSLRSLHVVDVDAAGQVLRQTRFDVSFSARAGQESTAFREELVVALPTGQFLLERRDEVDRMVGRPPLSYRVERAKGQWTQSMRRVTALGPAAPRHPIDAAALQRVRWDDAAERRAAITQLKSRFRQAWVMDTHELANWRHLATPGLLQHVRPRGNVDRAALIEQFGPHLYTWPLAENLFSIVAQVSPTGGPALEDLALLDPTDPDQWLIVLELEDGDDLYHYRFLVRRTR